LANKIQIEIATEKADPWSHPGCGLILNGSSLRFRFTERTQRCPCRKSDCTIPIAETVVL